METIKNYLDTMFANLPNNQSVIKAKDELWQMMEDKYNELISEGKTENEAVGTVISEFGNLSELAEALGLEKEINGADKDDSAFGDMKDAEDSKKESDDWNAGFSSKEASNVRVIAADEAEDLLQKRSKSAHYISLGVAIIILSVIGPILADVLLKGKYDIIGAISMVLIVACGVCVIVWGSTFERGFKASLKDRCTLSMDATKLVAGEKSVYSRNYNLTLTVGILLVVLGWIPTAIISEVLPKFEDASAVCLFLMVALGVMLIVNSGMRKNGYDLLLKLNGEGTMKAEYAPEDEKNVRYKSSVAEFVMSVYWPTVVCAYLLISFIFGNWALSWIIWPVTGILYAPLKKALTERVNQ